MGDEEVDLGLRHDAGPDGCPEPAEGEPGHALRRAAPLQPLPGLGRVEVDVAALLAHDPAQQVGEHGVASLGREPGVARLRRPLVDGAPGHVHGGELACQGGRQHRRHGAEPVPPAEPGAHGGDAPHAARLAVRLEHPSDGLPVPVLLERPEREERRDLGVSVHARHQQVAQVADRVVLDVVHVAQAPQGGGVERLRGERIEVDALDVELSRDAGVVLDAEGHGTSFSDRGGHVDDPRLSPSLGM